MRFCSAGAGRQRGRQAVPVPDDAGHRRGRQDVDALVLQGLGHLGRGVGVGARRDPVVVLDDRHGRAEPGERLRQLEPDRAAAEHEQRLRQLGQLERLDVVDPGNLVQAVDGRNGGARAGRDEDPVARELALPHAHRSGIGEARLAVDHLVARVDEALPPGLLGADEPVRALLQLRQVEARRAGLDAEVGGDGTEVAQQLGRGDVLLRRLARDVGALAAPALALDDRDGRTVVRAGTVRRLPGGRTGADDDQIEALH